MIYIVGIPSTRRRNSKLNSSYNNISMDIHELSSATGNLTEEDPFSDPFFQAEFEFLVPRYLGSDRSASAFVFSRWCVKTRRHRSR